LGSVFTYLQSCEVTFFIDLLSWRGGTFRWVKMSPVALADIGLGML
jgi:hypothetical protein